MFRRLSIALAASVCALAWSLAPAEEAPKRRVLYITTTAGFHHSACEYSVPVFQKMAERSGVLEVTASDKTDLITAESLKGFDVVIFSNTSGGKDKFPLSEENALALLEWIKGGKAFVGVHAATDSLADWAPYVEMLGGAFNGHPWTKRVKIDVEDPLHPSAVHIPSPWHLDDEIYTFKDWSRDKVHVILSLDVAGEENKGNRDDRDYALAWCHPYGEGRVFYTALGHKHEVWDDPLFQNHLLGGVLWALKIAPRDVARTIGLDFKEKAGSPVPEDHRLTLGHGKPGDWTRIFDGETLEMGEGKDWIPSDDLAVTQKHWTVQPGGILQGYSEGSPIESSHLYYIKKKYKNFEFRADICINRDGNSGIYFRSGQGSPRPNGQWRNGPGGYEAQVNNGWEPDPRKSGSFYPEPSIRNTPEQPDLQRYLGYDREKDDDNFWFNQHIVAVDNRFVIKLNGRVVVDHIDLNDKTRTPPGYFPEGYFAIQLHHGKDPGGRWGAALVKLKNIEVRELP